MQALYIVMFMTALMVSLILGLPRSEVEFKIDQAVVSEHMKAWHKAAVKRCGEITCNGSVDPRPSMFPSMLEGPAFDAARYSTRYDPVSKMLITHVNALVPASGLSYDVVMAALNETVQGESSSIGVFNAATDRIEFPHLTGIYERTFLDVPPVLANNIPDGSPVIITNL